MAGGLVHLLIGSINLLFTSSGSPVQPFLHRRVRTGTQHKRPTRRLVGEAVPPSFPRYSQIFPKPRL